MEKKNNGKNRLIIILSVVILLLVGIILYVFSDKLFDKDNQNNLEGKTIELVEKKASCTGVEFTYNELFINNKKIDLGFANNDSCSISSVETYKKANNFTVLEIMTGFVEPGKKLYIIDNNGNILKQIENLGNYEYIEKYYIENNILYMEAYRATQDPCYYKKDEVIGGVYKLEYLNNNKFSEITKTEDKTTNDKLKLTNETYDNMCEDNQNNLEGKTIELVEKKASCTGVEFTYNELFINNKKIDLGFTNNDSCSISSVETYKKANNFIVLEIMTGFVEPGKKIYIIDNNGNILKQIENLGNYEYIEKHYIENNILYMEAYRATQDPCYYKKDEVIGGVYKLEYLNNNKFSEITKIEDKTTNDKLKLTNETYDSFCK